MKTYDAQKLTAELAAAGIACNGCNSAGVVWDIDNQEIQGRADVAAVLAAHNPGPGPADYGAAARKVMDEKVKEHDYQYGIDNACTYVSSSVPAYKADAEALVAWRDAVWVTAYQIFAEVQAGQRAAPTISKFLSELPALTWPE